MVSKTMELKRHGASQEGVVTSDLEAVSHASDSPFSATCNWHGETRTESGRVKREPTEHNFRHKQGGAQQHTGADASPLLLALRSSYCLWRYCWMPKHGWNPDAVTVALSSSSLSPVATWNRKLNLRSAVHALTRLVLRNPRLLSFAWSLRRRRAATPVRRGTTVHCRLAPTGERTGRRVSPVSSRTLSLSKLRQPDGSLWRSCRRPSS